MSPVRFLVAPQQKGVTLQRVTPFCVVMVLCCDYTSTTQQNISQHVDNIYKDGELIVEATNKKFLLVRQEGNRKVKRNIDHYNLDMIIALSSRTVERAINF